MDFNQQINIVPSTKIATEAKLLKELYIQQVPYFLNLYRSVRLESDASPHIKAFWETLGWSHVFNGLMAEPELDKSRQAAENILAKYRKNDYFTLTIKDLPSRFRLLEIDYQGVGFSITDETDNLLDPPMKFILDEKNTIIDSYKSYLHWLMHQLILEAFPYKNPWHCSNLFISPEPAGIKPFPVLSPATIKITDEIWLLPHFAESLFGDLIVYKSFKILVDYILSLNSINFKLYVYYINHSSLELNNTVEKDLIKFENKFYKIVNTAKKDQTYRIGYINEMPVWFEFTEKSILNDEKTQVAKIYFSKEDEIKINELIINRNWL